MAMKWLCLQIPFTCALHGHAPLSTEDPSTFFQAVNRVAGKGAPSEKLAGHAKPYPTNAWWENLVLAEEPGDITANIFPMPYVMVADTSSLQVMAPSINIQSGGQDFDQSQALLLGATGLKGPTVQAWDELSLTVAWNASRSAMSAPIVRGSPYVTMEYTAATPEITSKQMLPLGGGKGNITVDGKVVECDGSAHLSGTVFSIEFIESDSTWLVFAPKSSQWLCEPSPFSLKAVDALTGVVRVALANNCTTGTGAHGCVDAKLGRDASAYAKLLTQHAGKYPVAGNVDFKVSGDSATVSWSWDTKSLQEAGDTQPLLQLAWPVHMPLLSDKVRQDALANPSSPFSDLRGKASVIVGDTWQLSYDLFPDVGFKAPRPVADELKSEILAALKTGDAGWNGSMADKDFDIPLNYQLGAGDTYFAGKLIARLARLIVIADELGESKEQYFQDMVKRLQRRIEIWLDPKTTEDPLLYDTSWGGVIACGCNYDDCGGKCKPRCTNEVSASGCPALSDAGANFGNGFYNDHHFHYGYFIYGAAVAAKYSPRWEEQWRQQLLAIVRDYGNPSSDDPSFPVVRHMDWFLGLSWAGGIPAAMRNGRNQESTSEAVNGYYALYLYGAVNTASYAAPLKDLGRLLTAMEVHGADTYWHVRKNSVYGDNFKHNVVGILWEHLPEFQTWFGAAPFFVHGIQQIPYTPISEYLLKTDWVKDDFPAFKAACEDTCESDGWSWIVCMEQALVDITGSRACLKALPDNAFDPSSAGSGGNSLTNSLHWIATRTATPPAPPSPPSPPPSPPAPPTPGAKCKFGDIVKCPGTTATCSGDQCCIDGSTCPSAETRFKGCSRGKTEDCTKAWVWELLV